MKFYARRILKLLIGLSTIAMLYLIFKTHSRGNTYFGDAEANVGFQNVIKSIFSRDSRHLTIEKQVQKSNSTVYRSGINLGAPSMATVMGSTGLEPVTTFRSFWKKVPYWDTTGYPPAFVSWLSSADSDCDGHMIGYNSNFLYAMDMVIDRNFCKCKKKGGEPIGTVFMQDEEDEYYKYDVGCFKAKCSSTPSYTFQGQNHLNKWMMSLSTENMVGEESKQDLVVEDFTIAVVRYEYANLYHTMTDWYNAFLIKEFFNKTSLDTNILLIDAHPTGSLDRVWSHLFSSTRRLSSLPTRTVFKNLVWGIMGYNSPMGISISSERIPLFEQFRTFFLDSYGIREDDLPRHKCQSFNILFIWRHDYVAHPRNPKGTIARKIANEMELVNYLKQKLPGTFRVKGSQIDVFDMKEQLDLVSWADVLIGMHGAGLTHALFLKKNSALIELTPNYMYGEEHFAAIAKWRNIAYSTWSNNDLHRELPNKSTIVPPSVVLTLIKKLIKDLCGPSAYYALFPQAAGNGTTDFKVVK